MVGLVAEARIAARFGCPVLAGGGTPAGAAEAARRLVEAGVDTLVSFGLAGGLDPALRPGAVLVPATILCAGRSYAADPALGRWFGGLSGHCLLAGTEIAGDAATKRRLYGTTGAHAIDLESGSVAQVAAALGLAFIAVRAICDPAERGLPPAALVALDRTGGIAGLLVLRSLLRSPGQFPAVLRLALDAAQGRRALVGLADRYAGAASRSSR